MPRQHVDRHAGLRPDDSGDAGEQGSVHDESRHRAQRADDGGLGHHRGEERVSPRPQSPEDREVTTSRAHRRIDAGQNATGRDEGDEVGDECEDAVEPPDLAEKVRDDRTHRVGEGQAIPLPVVHHVQHESGLRGAQLEQHRAQVRRELGVMPLHVLDARERDPQHAVRRCVRRLQDSHHRVDFLVLVRGVEDQPMERLEGVAHPQAESLRGERSHQRLVRRAGEDPAARLNRVAPPARILDLREKALDGADDAVAAIVVAHRQRDRRLHGGVAANLLEVGCRDVPRRRLQMKNGVEHELQPGPTRPEYCIEARACFDEGALRLSLHHPHHHQQPHGQCDAPRRHERRERVLPEAAVKDERQGHGHRVLRWRSAPQDG